jgi:hypothetical protein
MLFIKHLNIYLGKKTRLSKLVIKLILLHTCVDSVSLSMTSWWSVNCGPEPSGLGLNIGGNTPPAKIFECFGQT